MIEGHRHDDYTLLGHQHAEADVAALVVDLAAKAAAVHTHAESDVTSLVSDLAGKAASVHTHAYAATTHAHAEADVTSLVADLALKAPIASPSLTGVPLSTTAAVDVNTTQIATTAYVIAQAADATPAAVGTAAVGTATRFARADHAHGLVGAWTTYTPVWTASTTNPVLGNGTLTGAWVQFGKTVHFRATLTPGSTTTYGAGAYSISIPTTPAAFEQLCTLVFAKSTTNIFSGVGRISASTATVTRSLFVQNVATAAGWTPTVPAVLASGNVVTITGTYQTS